MQEILRDYDLSQGDLERIKNLNIDFSEVENRLSSYLDRLDSRERLLNPKIKKELAELISRWIVDTLSANYDTEYMDRVRKIGERCANASVPLHYVSASVSYVRGLLRDKILVSGGMDDDRLISSLDRALDMGLDLIVNAYREEELKFFLSTGKVERFFIGNLKRFSWFLDIFLIASLIFSSLLIIYWIALEISHIFAGTLPLKEGVLSILGSVLILYALSELINEEIKHLKGAPFSVKTFLGVALAAVIREILILSVSQTDVVKMLSMGAVLLALGLVFWLTSSPNREKAG